MLQRSFLLFCLLWCSPGVALGWTVSSGIHQTGLVELFTSQGCSSCPPADRWLSKLKSESNLWRRVVPVAFHVTYWDYLGWRDPFAHPANDRRQKRQAEEIRAGVYTPGMFLNRKEYRSWRMPGSTVHLQRGTVIGTLEASEEANTVVVRFHPQQAGLLQQPVVELTYLRSGLSTPVAAGENRGRQLQHDFVAAEVVKARMRKQGQHWVATLSTRPPPDSNAVALWLVDKNGNYIQAAGGWI